MSAGRQEEFRKNDSGRKKGRNLILDFSHVYPEEGEGPAKGIRRINLTGIDGTDMQQPLFPQLTSCGNWVADVLRDNPFLEQLILAGPDQKSMEGIPEELAEDRKEKLICISREEIKEGKIDEKVSRIHMELPIYISIDKDVLDRSGARTNWNQGDMPTDVLEKLLRYVFRHQKVIGVDICGECSFAEPLPELLEDQRVNRETDELLYRFLSDLFRKYD